MRQQLLSLLDRTPAPLARALRQEGRLTRLARPVVNWLAPTSHSVVTVKSGPAAGLRLVIAPRAEKYYWTGQHELHVQETIARVLESGDVFFDVGAHIGMMTLLAARRVGEDGRVVAFEPVEANRARLDRNLQLNAAAQVQVVDAAVGALPGRAELAYRGSSLTWTLSPAESREDGDVLATDILTLDDMADRYGLPALIKVDAEGAEVDVLRGGTAVIARRRSRFLVECTDQTALDQARELLRDYAFTHVGDNHWLAEPQPSTPPEPSAGTD